MDRTKNACDLPQFSADMMSEIVQEAVERSNRMDDLAKIVGDYGLDRLCAVVDILRPDRVGEPLTLEQLRQMNGQPVWVKWKDDRIPPHWYIVGDSKWNMMEFDAFKDYGEWLAYAYPPAQNERAECVGHDAETNADRIRSMSDEQLAEYIQKVQLDTAYSIKEQAGLTAKLAFAQTLPKLVKWLGCPADIETDDVLDFNTNRPQPDFVFRAEKELQKATNDLEQAARRGAPQADIFNLQRKVEYKWYVLELLKGV